MIEPVPLFVEFFYFCPGCKTRHTMTEGMLAYRKRTPEVDHIHCTICSLIFKITIKD